MPTERSVCYYTLCHVLFFPAGMLSQMATSSGLGSSWDHHLLTPSQFVQLVELFLGEDPSSDLVQSLSAFLRENFQETEQERAEKSVQVRMRCAVIKNYTSLYGTNCRILLKLNSRVKRLIPRPSCRLLLSCDSGT